MHSVWGELPPYETVSHPRTTNIFMQRQIFKLLARFSFVVLLNFIPMQNTCFLAAGVECATKSAQKGI